MLMLSETASMPLTLHSYTRLNGGIELAAEHIVLGRFSWNSGCSLCSWRCSQLRSRLVELTHEDLVQRRWVGAPSGLLHHLPAAVSWLMLNACTTCTPGPESPKSINTQGGCIQALHYKLTAAETYARVNAPWLS